MEVLPWVISSGWASGLNSYAVVLLLGLFGRLLGVDGVPPALERTDVLVAAAILTTLDLVADKIPYVDSAWDTVHTVIRPGLAAAVGALLAGQAGDLNTAAAAGLAALVALASHSIKASVRAAVNTSPEPVSNFAVSSTEDVAVVGMLSLSVLAPWVAAGLAVLALVVGGAVAITLVRRGLALRRAWRRPRAASGARPPDLSA